MLKKSASCVLASLRDSTYGLGKRLFPQAMGGRVKKIYASPLRSLRLDPVKARLGALGWAGVTVAFLTILNSCALLPEANPVDALQLVNFWVGCA